MLWIASRRLLFVHNPKCAGTAIQRALLNQLPDAVSAWGRRYDSGRDEIIDLAHVRLTHACSTLGISGDFESFGFVRNPYTRFVSAFRHFTHWNRDYALLTPEELAFDILDEERIRFDWKFVHFAPQYQFFYQRNLRIVSHLWKFEQLPTAWHEVQRTFSLTSALSVENRLDVGRGVVLGAALTRRLNQLYARDFALLDYPMNRVSLSTRKSRTPYARYQLLWPERRGLDVSDKTEV